jgi:phenylacetate-CoA ligase
MTVKVELYSKMFHGDMKQLKEIKNKITRVLKDETLITPNVELLEPGSLPPSTGKAIRVIDNRKI